MVHCVLSGFDTQDTRFSGPAESKYKRLLPDRNASAKKPISANTTDGRDLDR